MPLTLAVALLALAGSTAPADGDHDGLPDDQEQRLLQQFAPRFLVAPGDCAIAPGEFVSGIPVPTVSSSNGTIYGQAFPSAGGVELHYYHLWGKDCGRRGHPLDAEHVSVLLMPGKDGIFRARYWYASAHEGTICDISHGARAGDLGRELDGATVWISRGKHASFLSERLCGTGCGADVCDHPEALAVARIVNLGEPGAPMNGAIWIHSPAWRLAAKMQSDFSPSTVSAIDGGEDGSVVIVASHSRGVQQTVAAGNTSLNSTAGAAGVGMEKTAGAVGSGRREASHSISHSAGTVWRSLSRARKAAGDFVFGQPAAGGTDTQ